MEIIACGHVALPSPIRMCPHLVGTEDQPYCAVLTGRGLEFDICCATCDPPAELLTVCEGCADRAVWEFHELAEWRGEPEVLERPERVDRTPRHTPLPDGVAPVDLAPLPDGRWLFLLDAPYRVAPSDPASGDTVSTAQPTDNRFHGGHVVSPTGRWIADDCWAWGAAGTPHVWDPTRAEELCQRWYHWGKGMCWVGDDLLAVTGIGMDDEIMLDGVRVFDAVSGLEVTAFAGPRGVLFADGRRLYSVTDEGLEVWDPATGHRTGGVPGFVPTRQRRGELVAVADGALTTWRTA